MNGTIIDIEGIIAQVNTIELEDSSDKAHVIYISDGTKETTITILYGKISAIRSSFQQREP